MASRRPTRQPARLAAARRDQRLTDQIRADAAQRLREQLVVSLVPADEQIALAADAGANERDDTLTLYLVLPPVALDELTGGA